MIHLIDITDLYHPYQDPGDNFDLIMPYSLPDIDLVSVILDCTEKYRQPVAPHRIQKFTDRNGPREPGIIPVTQLNYIFDRNIPFAVSPFSPMKSPEDKMIDLPVFQQRGINQILNILNKSSEKIDIAVFSSARTLAAAYNREPELFHKKINRIHISAGASSPDFLEWNVELDQNAFVCLLRSDLPITLYPCAHRGPFDLENHNTFWSLENLSFIKNMDKKLKRYLWYAFERIQRSDFLRAMDEEPSDSEMQNIYQRSHNVWETAVWMELTGRKLVEKPDKSYCITTQDKIEKTDTILKSNLRPCKININDEGLFDFKITEEHTNFNFKNICRAKRNVVYLAVTAASGL